MMRKKLNCLAKRDLRKLIAQNVIELAAEQLASTARHELEINPSDIEMNEYSSDGPNLLIPDNLNDESTIVSYGFDTQNQNEENLEVLSNKFEENKLKSELEAWALIHDIKPAAMTSLLKILKIHHCFKNLPSDAMELLMIPSNSHEDCLSLENGIQSTGNRSSANNGVQKEISRIGLQLKILKDNQDKMLRKLERIEVFNQPTTDDAQLMLLESPKFPLPEFPLRTEEEMNDLEHKLSSSNFRSSLMEELRKLGGKGMSNVVSRQMQFLLTYSLGNSYSYYGTREKKPFSTLRLCDVIQDVVRIHNKDASNADIKEPIQTWLRHTKERLIKGNKTC